MTRPSGVEERPEAGGLNRDVVVRVDRRTNRALLVVVPVVILLCLGILSSLNILPRLHNPFGERIIDRSQPVLLQSIQDLSRYEAASGNFQVVVDLEKDAKFLPDFIRGQRTLFVGVGSVDAYVDFSRIGRDGVTVSGDGNRADLRLPHAQLERAALDTKNSYVFAQRQGLLNRIGAFFSSNPNSQQQVYALAQAKIEQAAQDTALTARAEQNTRTMLEGMLRSLGFREVTVQFADQP
jgi:Protein of unknown function (DUF4230)